MYARITPYKMKAGSRDATVEIMERVKADILGLQGMQHFINVMDDTGKGYIVALTSLPETPPELQEKINAIWANFAEYLESRPTPETYSVLADWKP